MNGPNLLGQLGCTNWRRSLINSSVSFSLFFVFFVASAGVIIRRRVMEPVIPGRHYPLIMTSVCDQSCSVPGPGPWSQSSPGSPPSLCLIFKIFLPGQWTNHVTLFVFSNTKKTGTSVQPIPRKALELFHFLIPPHLLIPGCMLVIVSVTR